jgi:hypothetical protein
VVTEGTFDPDNPVLASDHRGMPLTLPEVQSTGSETIGDGGPSVTSSFDEAGNEGNPQAGKEKDNNGLGQEKEKDNNGLGQEKEKDNNGQGNNANPPGQGNTNDPPGQGNVDNSGQGNTNNPPDQGNTNAPPGQEKEKDKTKK